MSKFQVGQTWRTRDGRVAEITAITDGRYPVEGKLGAAASCRTENGGHRRTGQQHESDLIELLPPSASPPQPEEMRAAIALTIALGMSPMFGTVVEILRSAVTRAEALNGRIAELERALAVPRAPTMVEQAVEQLACDLSRALGVTPPPPTSERGGERIGYWLRPLVARAETRRTDLDTAQARIAELEQDLTVAQAGAQGATNLTNAFHAMAETESARNLYNYASTKLELAKLREQIASAISRGALPSDFYQTLK